LDNVTQQNEDIHDSTSRNFFAWRCEVVRTEMRPFGRAQREGCGLWSVKASKYPLGHKHLQANCDCGRRSRLNMKTRRVYAYESREDAEQHCHALNRESEMIV
jgi:hypothetical protein